MTLYAFDRAPGPSIMLGSHGNQLLPRAFRLASSEVPTFKVVTGGTGQGKSKLLCSYALGCVASDVPVSVIDPHSLLARELVGHLLQRGFYANPRAYERLIYIDFADHKNRHPAFNFLAMHDSPHDAAYGVLEAAKRIWPSMADGSTPQIENVLLAGSYVLSVAGEPLTKMQALLTDKSFQERALQKVQDEDIRHFFLERFPRWGKPGSPLIESTSRRMLILTFAPELKFALGQRECLLDFRRLIDSGISVIYDLGGIESVEARKLLTALIVVGYEQAALSRAKTLADGTTRPRVQHQLIVDEAGAVIARSHEALTNLLAQARKFNFFATLAFQHWRMVPPELRDALLSNADVAVSFKAGRPDAELLAKHFGSVDPFLVQQPARSDSQRDQLMPIGSQWELWTKALQDLRPRQAFIRTPTKGTTKIRTVNLPNPQCHPDQLQQVLENYASRYLRPAAQIETEMRRTNDHEPIARPHYQDMWQEKARAQN